MIAIPRREPRIITVTPSEQDEAKKITVSKKGPLLTITPVFSESLLEKNPTFDAIKGWAKKMIQKILGKRYQ